MPHGVVVTLVTSLLRLGARKFSRARPRPLWTTRGASNPSHNFGGAQHAANNTQTGIGMGLVESFHAAHLKLKRAESKGNSSGRVRAPRFRKSQATELDANGTKGCHRKSSTQAPSNVSTSASASDVTVADEIYETYHELKLYSTIGTSEHAKTFWLYVLGDRCASQGIERDGISMSVVEYAQNVGINTDELGHCVSWMQRPEDRGQPWRGDLL
ncbi:hypothetical protein B0H13DRAFT_1888658 [Mycena leptocephala]|nr:hypothetical protein B0H13DRAFT_1888658 [Mycena leptocephala]